MPEPFISICVPAYRAESYLAETLASVRALTFPDWELIVTVDGSRDSTEKIVQDFAATVSQGVRYTRHDANRGLPATRNTGLSAARGQWLALLDADDVWRSDHLERCLAVAPASGPALVFGGSSIFDTTTGQEIERREPPNGPIDGLTGALFDGQLIIQPAAAMFNRAAYSLVGGFDSRFPICNDFDYWLRCGRAGVSFFYNGALTLRYRKHPGAMSRKSAALIAESAEVLLVNSRGFPGRKPADARRAARRRFLNAARITRSAEPAAAFRYLLRALRSFA